MSYYFEGIGAFSDKVPVVIEIGNIYTKAGFAYEASPKCVIPSEINVNTSLDQPKPVNRNLRDFENELDLYSMLVEFLRTIYFKYLLVDPKERKIVLVESIFTRTVWRNVLAKVLFHHFKVPNVMWLPYHLAATNSLGSQTALVVDFGRNEINVIPVIHGVTLLNDIHTIGLGTVEFDRNLKELAIKHCLDPYSKDELSKLINDEILEHLRINACFVGKFDQKHESAKRILKPFRYFIDGSHVVTFDGILREESGELWFNNDDLDGESLPLAIMETLRKIPIDERKVLASSILLTGGPAGMIGLKARLVRELTQLGNDSNFGHCPFEFKFFAPPANEMYLGWLGGANYASDMFITSHGITKEEFCRTEKAPPDWCDFRVQTSS